MDTDYKSRKQVNYDQLKAMIDFLKEHQQLAKGLMRGRRGKLHTLKLWNLCAKKLNGYKGGTVKDGKGWSKYWCDWKYRVRRRALELKAVKDTNRPVPDITPLSNLEESILSIIGDTAVDDVVIKIDPLAQGDTEDDDPDNTENNDETSDNQFLVNEPVLTKKKKRRHSSSRDLSDLDECAGPSSPPERKARFSVRNGDKAEIDNDDEASEFLNLEREKLENSKKMCESIQTIASEITRLADIMSHIRDVLINNRISL
ncbi:uncharacterized protein LOC113520938 [Galleria mellonella]|uniref:Uncharacterized protein LOC113520938 n=1 Tax=Galleria mellonella TaxID=7137 RepID=A0A6J1X727_GALME|nr:uncharacterized protein LOC113520938 [Galleria mellonella]